MLGLQKIILIKIYFALVLLIFLFNSHYCSAEEKSILNNGDFEAGRLRGWGVDGPAKVVETYVVWGEISELEEATDFPAAVPHSGKYFLILGGENVPATISQSIRIHQNATRAIITFWYACTPTTGSKLSVTFYSFLDAVLSGTIFPKFIELNSIGINRYRGRCPFHKEKTPSFSVNAEKQFYYCFGCGAGGNAIGFLMDYERLDFPEAVELLAHNCGLEVPKEESNRDEQQQERRRRDIIEVISGRCQAKAVIEHFQVDIFFLNARDIDFKIKKFSVIINV